MKQLTRQKNKDVLDKYFPEMQIWEHDFGEVPTNTIEAYAMAFLYIVAYGLFIYYYIKP